MRLKIKRKKKHRYKIDTKYTDRKCNRKQQQKKTKIFVAKDFNWTPDTRLTRLC